MLPGLSNSPCELSLTFSKLGDLLSLRHQYLIADDPAGRKSCFCCSEGDVAIAR